MVASTTRLLSLTGLHLHVHPNPASVTARVAAVVHPTTSTCTTVYTSDPRISTCTSRTWHVCGGTPTARRGGACLRDVHAVNRAPSVQSPCIATGCVRKLLCIRPVHTIPVRMREKKTSVLDYFPISCHSVAAHRGVCAYSAIPAGV